MSRPVCFLLCFRDPETGQPKRYQHAGHYLGTTTADRLDEHVEEHRTRHAAVLTAVAAAAGLDFKVTRIWPGGHDKERQLKTRSGALYCPDCTPHPQPGTTPPDPDAKYLTRRQREARALDREAPARGPVALLEREAVYLPVGEERPDAEQIEAAVSAFLQGIGAEPRKETEMADDTTLTGSDPVQLSPAPDVGADPAEVAAWEQAAWAAGEREREAALDAETGHAESAVLARERADAWRRGGYDGEARYWQEVAENHERQGGELRQAREQAGDPVRLNEAVRDWMADLPEAGREFLRVALEDAIEYREPDGGCADCEAEDGLCYDHAADLDRADDYRARLAMLGPEPESEAPQPAWLVPVMHGWREPQCELEAG